MKKQRAKKPFMEKVAALTKDDCGCLIWTGAKTAGNPMMRYNEKNTTARRAIWEHFNGPIPDGKVIKNTCECQDCVNIEHLELTTYQSIAKKCGKLGLMSGPLRSAKIATTKRKKYSALTEQQVKEIRQSDETGRSFSQRFGVSENLVSKIRTNKSWKQFSTPWAGLGAR